MIGEWFLGSRKFIIMILIIFAGLGFRLANLISGTDMVSLFSSVGVAFMGANTVEHMFGTINEWISSKKGTNAEVEEDGDA